MRTSYLFSVIVLILLLSHSYAQVGIGTTTPNPSAMLDVTSTSKGLLVPRVSLTGTADNTTVSSPQSPLLVYNTAAAGSGTTAVVPGFYYWNGSVWTNLSTYTLQQN